MFVTVAFAAFFIFCWKCYLDGRWPRVPAWMLFCMTFIALQGLWMCLNADSYYRWHRELITVRHLDMHPMLREVLSACPFQVPDARFLQSRWPRPQ